MSLLVGIKVFKSVFKLQGNYKEDLELNIDSGALPPTKHQPGAGV